MRKSPQRLARGSDWGDPVRVVGLRHDRYACPDVGDVVGSERSGSCARGAVRLQGRGGGRSLVVTTLDEHWSVRGGSCHRIVLSDHNALAWVDTPSGRVLAKWSAAPRRFRRLAALARLTGWLDGKGLPVSAPVAAADGGLQVEVDGASLSLQCEVVGDLLDTADADQVRAAGAVLARLHHALAVYPDIGRIPDLVDRSTSLATQVTGWLDSCPEHLPATARKALSRLVADAPRDPLPTQLVHGDFRSANVLCAGSGVAAVIDFEEARLDPRVAELARSAVMLGTRFRGWGPVSAEVRGGFLDGYQSERQLTPAEVHWWDVLVLWYSLLLVPTGDDPTGWGSEALSQLRKVGEDA
jgi:homoserine kinase type II